MGLVKLMPGLPHRSLLASYHTAAHAHLRAAVQRELVVLVRYDHAGAGLQVEVLLAADLGGGGGGGRKG